MSILLTDLDAPQSQGIIKKNQHHLKIKNIVDLERYPIDQLDHPCTLELIKEGKLQLKEKGVCIIHQFLTKEAVELMLTQTHEILPLVFHQEVVGNAYLSPKSLDLANDHPLNLEEITSLGVIAADQIPSYHCLQEVYTWDPLMNFISAVLGKEKIFRYADPMGALNLSIMKNDDYLRWHFDQTDFVASLTLQDSDVGGDFEFSPFIRNTQKQVENFEQVKSVLKGESLSVETLPMSAGTFVLFEGRNSIHRVTKILGETPRIVALLGYDKEEGIMSSQYLRKIRYGRG